MKFLTTGRILIFASTQLFGCTHTATFTVPYSETKNFETLNGRNLENYLLEKELSYSRTAQGVCLASTVFFGFSTTYILSTRKSDNTNAPSAALQSLYLTTLSGVCAAYFAFLSERAAVYLKGAGVEVEF